MDKPREKDHMEGNNMNHELVEQLHAITATTERLAVADVHEGEAVEDEQEGHLQVLVIHEDDQEEQGPPREEVAIVLQRTRLGYG